MSNPLRVYRHHDDAATDVHDFGELIQRSRNPVYEGVVSTLIAPPWRVQHFVWSVAI